MQPTVFGNYVLLKRLAVGGMAEVFVARAVDAEGAGTIAIKKILPAVARDAGFIGMFINEARIIAQLNHPNIVNIHELGMHDDAYFIAMEYVPCRDLRTVLARARRRQEILATPLTAFIAKNICDGLDYAHRKKNANGESLNIIHRDISPHNILCSYRGEVKIIDFGIARASNQSNLTQFGMLKGKLSYMSPEQARGEQVDRRSDIFSVGILLYEMLTNQTLFKGDSDFSTLELVRNPVIPAPSLFSSSISTALERVVLKALARDPDLRYQWASDLAADIMPFLVARGEVCTESHLSLFMQSAFAEELIREGAQTDLVGSFDPDSAEVARPPSSPSRAPRVLGRLSAVLDELPPTKEEPIRRRVGVTVELPQKDPTFDAEVPEDPTEPHGRALEAHLEAARSEHIAMSSEQAQAIVGPADAQDPGATAPLAAGAVAEPRVDDAADVAGSGPASGPDPGDVASSAGTQTCPSCGRRLPGDLFACPHDGTFLLAEVVGQRSISFNAKDGQTVSEIARDADLQPGTRIGEYEVDSTIGEGGMGTVYAATHTRLGTRVAIKVIHRSLASDPKALERFRDEANAVSAIGHPGVVSIFDIARLPDGRPGLVMELLIGESLSSRLRRPIDMSERLRICVEVCEIMEAAHAKNVVHRDLKPDNLFLVEDKGETHVKLLDFGVAKVLGASHKKRRKTHSGGIVGTPAYMAPEQIRGGQVDARADIYSLGVLFYRIICGRPPFVNKSMVELFMHHLQRQPPSPDTLDSRVPPMLSSILQQLLSKNPDNRPSLVRLRATLTATLHPQSKIAEASGTRARHPLRAKSHRGSRTRCAPCRQHGGVDCQR
jgi:serine/threonine protein kinase